MDAGSWIALLGFLVQVLTGTLQQAIGKYGSGVRGQLLSLAKDLASKLNKNNSLKEKFLNAINENNNTAVTAMMQGMGFGARAKSLADTISSNRALLQQGIDYYNSNATKLDSLLNEANNAVNNSTTLTGIASAYGTSKSVKDEMDKIEDPVDLTQNINGGINNAIQK